MIKKNAVRLAEKSRAAASRKRRFAATIKTSQFEKLCPGVVAAELLFAKLFSDDTIPPSEP
jgi:hypothetical protein